MFSALVVGVSLFLAPLPLAAQLFEDELRASKEESGEQKTPKCSFGAEFSVPAKASIVAAGAFRGRRLSRQMGKNCRWVPVA